MQIDANRYVLLGDSDGGIKGCALPSIVDYTLLSVLDLPTGTRPALTQYNQVGLKDLEQFGPVAGPTGAEVNPSVDIYTGGTVIYTNTTQPSAENYLISINLEKGHHYTFDLDDQPFDFRSLYTNLTIEDGFGTVLDIPDFGERSFGSALMEYVVEYSGYHLLDISAYGKFERVVRHDDAGGTVQTATPADGAVVLVFADSASHDIVVDFNPFEVGELIDLHAVSAITGFADLVANQMVQNGSDVVVTDGAGQSRTLQGTLLFDLSSDDFAF